MNWAKLFYAMVAALIAAPATAHADCGEDGQPPCAGPVPTVDEVVAVLAKLTDPDIPAANKTESSPPDSAPMKPGQSMII
jgi:hypothetical protein